MKAHIGVDTESGLVHAVIGSAANVNDITQTEAQFHRRKALPSGILATEAWPNLRKPGSHLVRDHVAGKAQGTEPDLQVGKVVSEGRTGRGQRQCHGRTPIPRCQVAFRLRQPTLTQTSQEHRAANDIARVEPSARAMWRKCAQRVEFMRFMMRAAIKGSALPAPRKASFTIDLAARRERDLVNCHQT
jgi:hypothetical protein